MLTPLPFQRFAYTPELGSWEFLLAPPPPDHVSYSATRRSTLPGRAS